MKTQINAAPGLRFHLLIFKNRSYISCCLISCFLKSNFSSMTALAACVYSAHASLDRRKESIPSASCCTFLSSIRYPVFRCAISSGIPACLVEMTGSPIAIASLRALGIPSTSPFGATSLGRQKRWAFSTLPQCHTSSFSREA